MEYKGFEYSVLQTANPTGWKWTIRLDESRFKVGSAFSRASAVTFVQQAIEKHLKKSRGRNNDEPSMLDQTGFGIRRGNACLGLISVVGAKRHNELFPPAIADNQFSHRRFRPSQRLAISPTRWCYTEFHQDQEIAVCLSP